MSSDKSLRFILEEIYQMAVRKKEANRNRPDSEKFAEMVRIRLGTRLPVYLPQRIHQNLITILNEFREKATQAGFQQFIIQTHFISAMEITPEVKKAIAMIRSAGWSVTNQMVFTAAASRRGHTAKLRQVLIETGIIPYYTFTVKGFLENQYNFATNARSVQEATEEKRFGLPVQLHKSGWKDKKSDLNYIPEWYQKIHQQKQIPFMATDRNVINLPGVGKSLTFRVIGITRYGKRILEFSHDHTRRHSPVVQEEDRVIMIESKPLLDYLNQLKSMGEVIQEYETIWCYSAGETETRLPAFDYPAQNLKITPYFTHFKNTRRKR
jgi:lysine 2,3-aminomutase